MLQAKKTGHIHIDLGSNLKAEAEIILKDMGLSITETVRIFLRQVVQEREIPFAVKYSANIPNSETYAAIAEVESGKTKKTNRSALKAIWNEE